MKTVLVVEDDRKVASFIQTGLGQEGYAVDVLHDGTDAGDQARTMDYDAVVMSTGFCGFMLGTTANAVANMGALVERYGPAPKAYLVVPLVGAFGIDFVNGLLITAALNLF